jgi:hypothetical protein
MQVSAPIAAHDSRAGLGHAVVEIDPGARLRRLDQAHAFSQVERFAWSLGIEAFEFVEDVEDVWIEGRKEFSDHAGVPEAQAGVVAEIEEFPAAQAGADIA